MSKNNSKMIVNKSDVEKTESTLKHDLLLNRALGAHSLYGLAEEATS